MSSQKGNVSRSRGQKHQNSVAFKNDKYGATVQLKKAISKVHDGLCQRCKSVVEWKVKYNKYKPLTQAKKCVKCSQKSVKDAYHVICRPCSLQLEICCKCGEKKDIVISIKSDQDNPEEDQQKCKRPHRKKDGLDRDEDDEDDFNCDDFSEPEEEEDDAEHSKNGPNISAATLSVSELDIKS
ncbi:uncharacterized protein C9orf85 homolog [Synchiropus splendidus]|uniref:uncharacterized protein C9orf85 homolog n=1 Tax=Synchiropus splendidus TaxID=270530 RepID=UPI00237DBFBA|nr:uncharacterized protein C9orf85 homolog [Synchiropus splendidus]